MDKILSSLFCCSVDSKDDADDRYAQSKKQPRVKPAANGHAHARAASGRASGAAPARAAPAPHKPAEAAPKAKMMEDEHLVNETDTITNTNDEPSAAAAAEKAADAAPPTDLLTQVEENGQSTASAPTADSFDDDDDEVLDLTKLQVGQLFNPETGWLLGKKDVAKYGQKKCLILDLDETLVHSSFKYLRVADFVIPVQIDNQVHHVYVIKRPGVDEFLKKVGQWFEVVVFTALVLKYGDPLLDKLDIHAAVHHRLFRDLCYNYQGNFIKNLSQIGRPLADTIIIDNSPASYIFHPQHSIPISSWFSDTHDNELLDLLPFLEDISKPNVDDVGLVLDISL